MAISIDWPNKLITVNQTDPELTLLGGTIYQADTNAIRLAILALEDDSEGMPWPRVTRHATEVTVAGTTFARTIEIINGYQIQFLPNSSWSVILAGSNNNFFDVQAGVLAQNQVQVIATNSAGLVVTATSGLTSGEAADLASAKTEATRARKLLSNRQELVDTGPDVRIRTYDDDGTTQLEENVVTDPNDNKPTVSGITKRGASQ